MEIYIGIKAINYNFHEMKAHINNNQNNFSDKIRSIYLNFIFFFIHFNKNKNQAFCIFCIEFCEYFFKNISLNIFILILS